MSKKALIYSKVNINNAYEEYSKASQAMQQEDEFVSACFGYSNITSFGEPEMDWDAWEIILDRLKDNFHVHEMNVGDWAESGVGDVEGTRCTVKVNCTHLISENYKTLRFFNIIFDAKSLLVGYLVTLTEPDEDNTQEIESELIRFIDEDGNTDPSDNGYFGEQGEYASDLTAFSEMSDNWEEDE
jgi:hypothetical protein